MLDRSVRELEGVAPRGVRLTRQAHGWDARGSLRFSEFTLADTQRGAGDLDQPRKVQRFGRVERTMRAPSLRHVIRLGRLAVSLLGTDERLDGAVVLRE